MNNIFAVRVEHALGTSETFGLWDNFQDAYEYAKRKAEETQLELIELKHETNQIASGIPSIVGYTTSLELEGVATWYVIKIKPVN